MAFLVTACPVAGCSRRHGVQAIRRVSPLRPADDSGTRLSAEVSHHTSGTAQVDKPAR